MRDWNNETNSPLPAFGHPLPIGWGEGAISGGSVPGAALRLPRADITRPFRTLVFGSLRSHTKLRRRVTVHGKRFFAFAHGLEP